MTSPRTTSDTKYAPIRRSMHRYGRIELALTNLKKAGVEKFKATDIQKQVNMDTAAIAKILHFTNGVEYARSTRSYWFVGNEIRVENGR